MSKVSDLENQVDELLELYNELVIPYMKIRRDMPFPTEPERSETDGEHSFTLAMLSITLAERMKLGLDSGLIAKYALIHDLVEVHAGDTSARADEAEHATKVDREHEAYLLIKEKHLADAPWIIEHIDAYEKRQDEESKFVYALDKTMGSFAHFASGIDEWMTRYPEKKSLLLVRDRLRKKAESYPPLLPFIDHVFEKLVKIYDVANSKPR